MPIALAIPPLTVKNRGGALIYDSALIQANTVYNFADDQYSSILCMYENQTNVIFSISVLIDMQ